MLGVGLGLRQAEATGLTGDRIDWLGRAVRIGHASSSTTLNLYAHLWPGDEDRIPQAVDQAVALLGAED